MKAILAIAAFFLLAPIASAAQLITINTNANLSTTAEQFIAFGSPVLATAMGSFLGTMPDSGIVGDMTFMLLTAPGAATSRVATMMYNGATTTQTCTIANSATSCTMTGVNTKYVAGDQIAIALVPVNTPTASRTMLAGMFTPFTNGDIVIGQREQPALNIALDTYAWTSGTLNTPGTVEATSTALMPIAGAFSNLYMSTNGGVGVGVGKGYIFTFKDNFASTSLAASITNNATTANDTSDTASVNQLDQVDLSIHPTLTPTTRSSGGAMVFRATNPAIQTVLLSSSSITADSATADRFLGLSGDGSLISNETNIQVQTPSAYVFTTICASTTAPGGAATRIFALRDNSSTTTVSVTLTGAQTNACTSSSFTAASGDLLSFVDSSAGGAATGNPLISMTGYSVPQTPKAYVQGGALSIKGGSYSLE